MSYPSYLIHYNKNHSKTNGQFISGDGDGDGIANDHAHRSAQYARDSRKLYKAMKRAKSWSGDSKAEQVARNNQALKRAAQDQKLQEAYKNMDVAAERRSVAKVKEPDYWDDKETISKAIKDFQKDWPDWDKDPTDHKMFGYYVEAASEKSKSWAKKVSDYESKLKKIGTESWESAHDKFDKELSRVAKEFTGDLADQPYRGIYHTYYDEIKSILRNTVYEN